MPRVLLCAGCCLAALLTVVPVRAEEPPTVEVSGGGEIGGHLWSAYTNTTVVLSGWLAGVPKSIREDGWRLRAGAGYWRSKWRIGEDVAAATGMPARAKLRGSSADILLGYHGTIGALTLKIYAGIEYADASANYDGTVLWSGFDNVGAKATLESWYNLTSDAYLQIDASWFSRGDGLSGRARLGYRASPELSFGPELGRWSVLIDPNDPWARNEHIRSHRYGGFVRYEWSAGEISVSAGLTDGADDNDFYATLNALLRF